MSSRYIEDDLFIITTDSNGYVIQHKESGKRIGINNNAIPFNSSDDYIRGYAKCLAYQEQWIK